MNKGAWAIVKEINESRLKATAFTDSINSATQAAKQLLAYNNADEVIISRQPTQKGLRFSLTANKYSR